nr:iron ABC transporter permease [Propionibacterium sp.]
MGPAREHPWTTAGALAAVAVALLPLAYLAVRSADVGGARLAAEILTPRVALLTARSLALAGLVGVLCVGLGLGLALLVTRTRVPFRRTLAVLAALPLAVPSYVAAYAWVAVADLWSGSRFDGFWAAVVVLTLYTYPYVYLPVAAALVGADPGPEEVARSLGRTPAETFREVTLPRLRPALVSGFLLAALYVLSDFGAVSILRVDTFTRAIFTALSSGFDRVGALGLSNVLVLLSLGLLLLGADRSRGRTRYARSSGARPPGRVRLGRATAPALIGAGGVLALALGVPGAALGRWLAAGASRPGAASEIAAAAAASLGVSLLGALLTTALALPLGLLVARTPTPAVLLLERAAYLAHSLPGVVVGLSLVFFGVNVAYPLYQSVWLLAVAYAALFLPLAVGAIAAAAGQATAGVEDAARSLGATPGAVFRRLTLPLAAPGIGAGAALVLLACLKELPATLLLRPTGMDTLATRVWSHTAVEAYAGAAPYAALVVLLAAGPTWALVHGSGLIGRTHP